jgi:hypothetical protein
MEDSAKMLPHLTRLLVVLMGFRKEKGVKEFIE